MPNQLIDKFDLDPCHIAVGLRDAHCHHDEKQCSLIIFSRGFEAFGLFCKLEQESFLGDARRLKVEPRVGYHAKADLRKDVGQPLNLGSHKHLRRLTSPSLESHANRNAAVDTAVEIDVFLSPFLENMLAMRNSHDGGCCRRRVRDSWRRTDGRAPGVKSVMAFERIAHECMRLHPGGGVARDVRNALQKVVEHDRERPTLGMVSIAERWRS